MDLVGAAKAHVQGEIADLEKPDGDIMPHFLWFGPHGLGLMPLFMMTDDEAKEQIAQAMTAALVVGRATEAVFVSTAYIVKRDRADLDDVVPSEAPDRVEMVMLMHTTGEGSAMTTAVITRHPDRPPTLSDWDNNDEFTVAGGRFGDATDLGLKFVAAMPKEMTDIIDEAWAEGRQQDLIQRFMKVAHTEMAKKSGRIKVAPPEVTTIDPR